MNYNVLRTLLKSIPSVEIVEKSSGLPFDNLSQARKTVQKVKKTGPRFFVAPVLKNKHWLLYILQRNKQEIFFDSIQFQRSNACGAYCVVFVLGLVAGKSQDFLETCFKNFNSEEIVINLLKRHFACL